MSFVFHHTNKEQKTVSQSFYIQPTDIILSTSWVLKKRHPEKKNLVLQLQGKLILVSWDSGQENITQNSEQHPFRLHTRFLGE